MRDSLKSINNWKWRRRGIRKDEELKEPQQVNGHFWDSLVKYYEGKSPPSRQHAYNTHSRTFANTPRASSSSTSSNDNNNSQPNKQTQSGNQTQSTKIT